MEYLLIVLLVGAALIGGGIYCLGLAFTGHAIVGVILILMGIVWLANRLFTRYHSRGGVGPGPTL